MILEHALSNRRRTVKRNSPEHVRLRNEGWYDVTPRPSPAQLVQRKRWKLLGLIHRTIQNIEEVQQQCPDQLTGIERVHLNQAINILRNHTLPKIREGG